MSDNSEIIANESTASQSTPGQLEPKKATWKKLRGKPIDISEMPESAWIEEKKADFIRVVGIRFGEYGRVSEYETRGLKLKLNDAVIVKTSEYGTRFGRVVKPPMRLDNTELKLRLTDITRIANEEDFTRYEKQQSMQERGVERTTSAVNRLNLKMTILQVEYSLDCRKATVFFAAEGRVDFRELLRELVHDLKAKVDLRQVGARDQTKQIGAIGMCGEETCCSRFIDKFHGVSIKMAKDQNLSLKPTKVSGMCGRLKCCLAYEYRDYLEGAKTVPKVGKCVKCKSGGGGTVRDVDIPRQTVLVQMDDGTMVVLPASEVVEERTLHGRRSQSGDEEEPVVATTDTSALVDQIKTASTEQSTEQAVEQKADQKTDQPTDQPTDQAKEESNNE